MVYPHLTRAALAAQAAELARHRPPPAPRFPCRVTVREGGHVYTYEGLFAHTFDAYDDALDRFPACERIAVKALPIQHLRRAAA